MRGAARLRVASTALAHRTHHLTAPLHLRPTFLIIGAQKSGTTSLFEWLARHPDLRLPATKELHHFDRPRAPHLAHYRVRFPMRPLFGSRPRTGEATPDYLFYPWVGSEVVRDVPGAKFVVLLREPVARARSQYEMVRSRGHEPLSFLDALRAEEARLAATGWPARPRSRADLDPQNLFSYAARGRYAEQLGRWFDLVGRDRVFVARFEDLVSDPSSVLDPLQRFLGLPTVVVGSELPHAFTGTSNAGSEPEAEAWLRTHFEAPNEALRALTGITWT